MAAYHGSESSVCVIDCGTAITIDVVDAAGIHQGGLIAPGIDMMRRSLAQDTAAIGPIRTGGRATALLARDTTGCVNSGVMHMAGALIDRVTGDAAGYGNLEAVITGGDAENTAAAVTPSTAIRSRSGSEGGCHSRQGGLMRHVIYLLVITNLVYFSWNLLQNVPEKGGASLVGRLPPNVRRLEMIQVMRRARFPLTRMPAHCGATPSDAARWESRGTAGDGGYQPCRTLTASEPPGAAAPSLTCHVLGPFPDVSEMKSVEDRLHELGYQPRERTGDTRVDAGYWTYLPAMEREDALRITRMLKEKNDRDFLIMKGNAISLGAFDSRSKVDLRVKMLNKYGLEPVVEPLYKTVPGAGWILICGTMNAAYWKHTG